MQLTKVGDVYILDFGDLVQYVYEELKAKDKEMDVRDRRIIEEVIRKIIDDQLTVNMHWTKNKTAPEPATYLRLLPAAIDAYHKPYYLMTNLVDRVVSLINEILELPTWLVLDVKKKGHCQLSVEVEQDFRITDWMEKHAREYGVLGQRHTW